MTDFSQKTCGNKLYVEEDWNSLLDHGLEKCASFIIRNNDGTYEAINGSTGKIDYNGTDVATLIATIRAISPNGCTIFLKQNINWIAESIPDKLVIIGENAETVKIVHPTPDAEYVYVGSQTVLQNVSIKDKMGLDQGLSPNDYRRFQFYYNAREIAMPCGNWQRQFATIDVGEPGLDRPGIGVSQYGNGDAFYAGVQDNGVGLNIMVDENQPAKTGKGITIYNYGAGRGLWLLSKPGATGNLIQTSSEVDVPALDISADTVPTTDDFIIHSTMKTSGRFLNLYHAVSTFTGAGIIMNFGCSGGSFTGSFISLSKDGVELFVIDSDGDINSASDILPKVTLSHNIGLPAKVWGAIYAADIYLYNSMIPSVDSGGFLGSDALRFGLVRGTLVKGDTVQADAFKSGTSWGGTDNVAVAKVGGGTRTLHFVGGIFTGYTDS